MRDRLFHGAAQLLFLALLACVGFIIIAVGMTDGENAVRAFGGLEYLPAPVKSVKYAYFVDMVFPLSYGAGLICLISAYSRRSNRPLSRILILSALLVVLFDLVENTLVSSAMSNGAEMPPHAVVLTVLKFALLAFTLAGTSVLLEVRTGMDRLLVFVMRFAVPILIGLMVAGIGGKPVQILTSLVILLVIAALARTAWREHLNLQEIARQPAVEAAGTTTVSPVSKPTERTRATATSQNDVVTKPAKPVAIIQIPAAKPVTKKSKPAKVKKKKKSKARNGSG